VDATSVTLRFTPLPVHVRTARLVAVAVGRNAGLGEQVLDEVRLAVGEASSRAVDLHQSHCPDQPVTMRVADSGSSFLVEVVDRVPQRDVPRRADPSHALDQVGAKEAQMLGEGRTDRAQDDDELAHSLGLAVIEGLVDDVEFDHQPDGLVLRMTWPLSAADELLKNFPRSAVAPSSE